MCPSVGNLVPGPMEPATQRGRSGVENSSRTAPASSAALRVSSRARSPRPYSARTTRVGPAEVVRAQTQELEVRPHGAVEDDDPLAQRLQVRGGRGVEPTEEFWR